MIKYKYNVKCKHYGIFTQGGNKNEYSKSNIKSTKSELSDYRDGNAVSVTGQEKIIDIAVVNDVSIKW